MKPSPFSYHRPADVAEALATLAGLPDAKVLAGGQSLLPILSMRLAAPAHLVDINRLTELAGITAPARTACRSAHWPGTPALERDDAAFAVQPLLRQGSQRSPTRRSATAAPRRLARARRPER